MSGLVHGLLLVIIAALLYEIRQEIQGVKDIISRISDIQSKGIKDERAK